MTTRATAALLALLATSAAAVDPPGSAKANESLQVCSQAGRETSLEEKRRLLARGLALAEEAIKDDEQDAKAHFAVFCNVGKEMRLRGVSLSSLTSVRRLRREVDRTIELAPDYADALVGKGSLLLELPRLLGGDRDEAERLLRAALRIDPDFVEAHLALARALEARDADDEARSEARRALEVAERDRDGERAQEARELLDRIGR